MEKYRFDSQYPDRCCVACGSPYTHLHHIFPGWGRRKISDRYGFVVPLCACHHTGLEGVHSNPNTGLDISLKKDAQAFFEANIGTREQFIKEFGRNYI